MFGKIKNYVQDQVALVKLEGVEALARVASKLVFVLLVSMFIMFFILLLSFAAAAYLGSIYGRSVGFLIITGFYLVSILLLIVFRKQIQNLILNLTIAASMNDKDEEKYN